MTTTSANKLSPTIGSSTGKPVVASPGFLPGGAKLPGIPGVSLPIV
jgi:hypothetical protein